jgi:hypothetical protein
MTLEITGAAQQPDCLCTYGLSVVAASVVEDSAVQGRADDVGMNRDAGLASV